MEKLVSECNFAECESLEKIVVENPACTFSYLGNINNYYDEVSKKEIYNGKIYGYENSTAQAYAEKYGYNFESLGEYKESEWNVADVVKLQRYLVKLDSEISSKYDLNADEKINVFDDVILKRKVIYV